MRKAILLLSLLAFASVAQAQPVPSHAYSHADGSFDTINLDGLDGSGLTGVGGGGMAPPVSSVVNIPDSGDGNPGIYSETTWASTTQYTCGDPDGCELYLDGAAPAPTDTQAFTYTFAAGAGLDFIFVNNWDASPMFVWDGTNGIDGTPAFYNLTFNAAASQWQDTPTSFSFLSGFPYKVMRQDGTFGSGSTFFFFTEDLGGDGTFSVNTNNSGGTNGSIGVASGTISIGGDQIRAMNGNSTTPAYSFTSNSDMGMFRGDPSGTGVQGLVMQNRQWGATQPGMAYIRLKESNDPYRGFEIWANDPSDYDDWASIKTQFGGNASIYWDVGTDTAFNNPDTIMRLTESRFNVDIGDNGSNELIATDNYLATIADEGFVSWMHSMFYGGDHHNFNNITLTEATPAPVLTVNNNNGGTDWATGGESQVFVGAEDATDEQTWVGKAMFVIFEDPGGTQQCSVSGTPETHSLATTGTLSCTIAAAVIGGNNCQFSVTCTSTLTTTRYEAFPSIEFYGRDGLASNFGLSFP